MKYLPWAVSDKRPGVVLDNCGCTVIDLTNHPAIGYGYSAMEICEFLVSRANVLAEKEKQEQERVKYDHK